MELLNNFLRLISNWIFIWTNTRHFQSKKFCSHTRTTHSLFQYFPYTLIFHLCFFFCRRLFFIFIYIYICMLFFLLLSLFSCFCFNFGCGECEQNFLLPSTTRSFFFSFLKYLEDSYFFCSRSKRKSMKTKFFCSRLRKQLNWRNGSNNY